MPIPLRGDRAAHDALTYPELHATDLEQGKPLYHLPDPVQPDDLVMWSAAGYWVSRTLDYLRSRLLLAYSNLVNGQVLVAVNGFWVNKTLAEAGISVVGHTHETSQLVGQTMIGWLDNGNPDAPELVFAGSDEVTIWENL